MSPETDDAAHHARDDQRNDHHQKQAQEDLAAQFKLDGDLRSRNREPDSGHDGNADIQGQTLFLRFGTWALGGALGVSGRLNVSSLWHLPTATKRFGKALSGGVF